jgi:hypothetical protein
MRPGAAGGRQAISFERQVTAKLRLKIDWTHPVFKVDQAETNRQGGTVAKMGDYALPREEAFRYVAGDDRRPLLVLRECDKCKGSDDALLSRRISNERTQLMAKWFRCVKLPVHVLKSNHPFHALFEGDHPPHLFLARADGSGAVPLDGNQSQSELWQAMGKLLDETYVGNHTTALRDWFKLLTQFDHLDSRRIELNEALDREIEKSGPDSAKTKTIRQALAKLEKQREELLEKEAKLIELGGFRAKPEPKTADAAGAAGENR